MRRIESGRLALAAIVFISAAPATLQAQAPPPAVQAMLRDLEQVEQKLTALVEAMPASAYDWRPGEGVRSTGEVVMHIAADNYFLTTPAGVAAPASTGIKANEYPTVLAYETRPTLKAEALAEMKASFAHLRSAMTQSNDAMLSGKMNVFGMELTGLELWILTTTHLHEHLGQLIAYARSNGVVPPWSN